MSEIQLKEAAITSLGAQVREAEAELDQIRDAGIRFALFLKKNSITPYNDAMIAYLDEMIKEERQYVEHAKTHNIQAERNEQRLKNLERSKHSYIQRIDLLERHMNESDNAEMLDEQGVDDLANQLYELKNWGKNLHHLRGMLDWSKMNDFREQQCRPKVSKMWQALGCIADTASSAVRGLEPSELDYRTPKITTPQDLIVPKETIPGKTSSAPGLGPKLDPVHKQRLDQAAVVSRDEG